MSKYFNRLFGNAAAKERIGSAILSSTLPHALLICGPEGSGKSTLATEIAAALNCSEGGKGGTALPCHACNNCRRIAAGGFTDVKWLSRSDDKATIGVEEIRDFRDDMFLSATESDYKIYIIDDAERLTFNAQNALLKVLEEPPSSVVIMLLADGADNILTTVKSRTQYIAMERFGEDELIKALGEARARGEIPSLPDTERLRALMMSADGRIGKALTLIGGKLASEAEEERKLTEEVIRALKQSTPYSELYSALAALPTKRTELSEALESIISALRDLILLKFDENAPLVFFYDRATAREIAASMSSKRLLGIYDVMEATLDDNNKNANISALTASLGAKIKLI